MVCLNALTATFAEQQGRWKITDLLARSTGENKIQTLKKEIYAVITSKN